MLDLVYVLCILCIFFFFKHNTADDMRISDLSSDVCSSYLSLARRSAIRWFSSAGGGVAGVWSVMDEIVCRRSGLRPRRPFVGRGYAPDAGNYGTAMRS